MCEEAGQGSSTASHCIACGLTTGYQGISPKSCGSRSEAEGSNKGWMIRMVRVIRVIRVVRAYWPCYGLMHSTEVAYQGS